MTSVDEDVKYLDTRSETWKYIRARKIHRKNKNAKRKEIFIKMVGGKE